MEIHCPKGWVRSGHHHAIPAMITILAGSCNSSDLCGIDTCEHKDDSPKAIQAHVRAVLDCGDLRVQLEEERKSELYTKFHKRGLRVIK